MFSRLPTCPFRLALSALTACTAAIAPADASFAQAASLPPLEALYAQASVGRTEEALLQATQLIDNAVNPAPALEARAYLYRDLKHYTEALADYLRLLALDANSKPGAVGAVLALRALGAAQLAQQYAKQHPQWFSARELQDIDYAAASALTRLGAADLQTGPAAFELTDRALEHFKAFAVHSELASPALLPQSVGFDYLVAQFNRRRFDLVCAGFEQLENAGVPLPDYLVHVAAQSYAALRRPQRALALLEPIAERNQTDVDFVQSYFYALVDNEQHARAQAWLDAAVARTPSYLDADIERLRRPNPAYIRLVALVAWAQAFDDRLPAARRSFEAALTEAPANEGLRDGMGTVELWSGRPRAAHAQFLQALALNPGALEPRRGLLAADAARGDEQALQEGLDALQAQFPFDAQLARMRSDQAIRTGANVTFGVGQTASHVPLRDAAPEYSAHFQVKSALFADDWRIVAGGSGLQSSPDGAAIVQAWGSAGVELLRRDLVATTAVTHNRSGRSGISASVRYSPADGWALGAEGESLTGEVPARAAQNGVHGRRAAVSLEWQSRAPCTLSTNLNRTALSDNNLLTSAAVKWRETWHQQSDRQLWTAMAASVASATMQTVPYFSPRRSATAMVTLGASALGSRQAWLDRSLWHHAEVDLGQTRQAGFGGMAAGAARYRVAYRASARLSFELMFERARRVYDGRPEMQNAVRLEVSVAP